MVEHTFVGEYAQYIKSECWKCESSPTGAHYWIGIDGYTGSKSRFRCKYCGKDKEFVTRINKEIQISRSKGGNNEQGE